MAEGNGNFISRALAARMRGYNGAGVLSAALNTDDYQDMERQRIERENYMAEQMQRQRANDSYVDTLREFMKPVQEAQKKASISTANYNAALAENNLASLPARQEAQKDEMALQAERRQDERENRSLNRAAKKQAFNDSFVASSKKSFSEQMSGDERVSNLSTVEFEMMKKDPNYKILETFHLAGRAMQLIKDGNLDALDCVKDALDMYDIKLDDKNGNYFITLPGKEPIQMGTPQGDAALDAVMAEAPEMRKRLIDTYHKTSFGNTQGFAPGRITADMVNDLQQIIGGDRETAFKTVEGFIKTYDGRDVLAMCLNQAMKKAMTDGKFDSEEMQGLYPYFKREGWTLSAGDINNPATLRFTNSVLGINDIKLDEFKKILEANDRVTPAFEMEKQALKAKYDAGIQEQNLKMLKRIKQDIGGGDEGQTQTNGNEGQILNNNLGSSWYGVKAVSRKKLKEANVAVGETLDTFENLGIGERDENGVFNFNHNIPFDALKQAAEAEQDIASNNGIDTDNARFYVKPLYDKVKTVVDVFNFMIDFHYSSYENINERKARNKNGYYIDWNDAFAEEEKNRHEKFNSLVSAMRGKGVKINNGLKEGQRLDADVDNRRYLRGLYNWLKPYMTPEMEQKYKQAMQDEDWDYGRKGGAKKK